MYFDDKAPMGGGTPADDTATDKDELDMGDKKEETTETPDEGADVM